MSATTAKRGRTPVNRPAKARDDRLRVLEKGLIACYEIIDMIRKEMASLNAASAQPDRSEES